MTYEERLRKQAKQCQHSESCKEIASPTHEGRLCDEHARKHLAWGTMDINCGHSPNL